MSVKVPAALGGDQAGGGHWSRRTRPALASRVAFPAIECWPCRRRRSADPTEICCGAVEFHGALPEDSDHGVGAHDDKVVPPRKVSVPSLSTSVPSSMVSVSPLRAETIPETRSEPPPCTLLPANTCAAVKVTVVVVTEVVVSVVSVGVVSVGVVSVGVGGCRRRRGRGLVGGGQRAEGHGQGAGAELANSPIPRRRWIRCR